MKNRFAWFGSKVMRERGCEWENEFPFVPLDLEM